MCGSISIEFAKAIKLYKDDSPVAKTTPVVETPVTPVVNTTVEEVEVVLPQTPSGSTIPKKKVEEVKVEEVAPTTQPTVEVIPNADETKVTEKVIENAKTETVETKPLENAKTITTSNGSTVNADRLAAIKAKMAALKNANK